MYVKQEYAKWLLDATSKNFSKKGVHNFTDLGFVDAFAEQLNVMARARNYKEGERIMPSDLVLLKETVQTILEDMKEGMLDERETLEQSENHTGKFTLQERGNYSPLFAMAEVTDHLYAMAMKTLGCPDIPESFGSDITDLIGALSSKAELEMKEKEYKKTDVEKRYAEQRKKSADTVRNAVASNRQRIVEKTASPLRVAQYAGEYYALKKRQEGHTAVWRFFHKKENEKRTKLLENMKNVLSSALGKDIDIDTLTPMEIAVAFNKTKAAEAFAKNGIAKRTQMSDTHFEHEATLTERAENDKENPHKGIVYDEANHLALKFPEKMFEKNEAITFENRVYDDDSKAVDLSKEENEIKNIPIPQIKSQL